MKICRDNSFDHFLDFFTLFADIPLHKLTRSIITRAHVFFIYMKAEEAFEFGEGGHFLNLFLNL